MLDNLFVEDFRAEDTYYDRWAPNRNLYRFIGGVLRRLSAWLLPKAYGFLGVCSMRLNATRDPNRMIKLVYLR